MTLRDALLKSKETGKDICRECGDGGWATWKEGWVYKFTGEDILADDWEIIE